MSPRSTRLATAESAATPRMRATSGREHGPRYATIASVSSAAWESPRSTGRSKRRARVGRVATRAEGVATRDLLEDDSAPTLAEALPEEAEGRLDPFGVVVRGLGQLLHGEWGRRDDEQRLNGSSEPVDRVRGDQAERAFPAEILSSSGLETLIGAKA